MSLIVIRTLDLLFSSPGQSPGRAVVLSPASASALAAVLAKCQSFYVEVFYVMGKALSGELSCPCDRSCYTPAHALRQIFCIFFHLSVTIAITTSYRFQNDVIKTSFCRGTKLNSYLFPSCYGNRTMLSSHL